MMEALSDLSVRQLAAMLAQKQCSAVELAEHYLQRIAQIDPLLNSFILVDTEKTLAEARTADLCRAQGQAGVLTGIPVAHKDIFCAQGWRSSCASKMLINFVAPYDAHIIRRCKQAGMVTLGRTNMDEFAMGSSTENSYFGPTKNPWDRQAVPGGSSGGAAAAVAARLSPLATASDTGGSIRQPAAFCGVTGIKPTYGLLSRYGMIAYASSFDQAGVIAANAEDCGYLLQQLVDYDCRDATCVAYAPPSYQDGYSRSLKGRRLGVPKQYFGEGLQSEVAAAIEAALVCYRRLGAEVVDIDLPHAHQALAPYYILTSAEASSNLARFDGVRYGHRSQHYVNLDDMYQRSRTEGFGKVVRERILMGTYVLSQGYYDAYYVKAQRARRIISDDFTVAFQHCDLLVAPVSPTVAWDLGTKTDDQVAMWLSDLYTVAVNLAGLPALSHPIGFAPNKRPIGLQLIAAHGQEMQLLNVAYQYQQHSDWHRQSPSFT